MSTLRRTVRGRIGWWLRCWADRIDPRAAARLTSMSFTFEQGKGRRLREDGRGCRLAYLGEEEFERAHTEADNPPLRVNWSTGTVHPPGTYLGEHRDL